MSYITGNRESYKESQSRPAREWDVLANLLGCYGESKASHSLWEDLQPPRRTDSEVLAQAFNVPVALFLLK